MGRPERPVDPADGPVQRFAWELRRLREKAGAPSYRQLSRRAHFSATALSEAAGGEHHAVSGGEQRGHEGVLVRPRGEAREHLLELVHDHEFGPAESGSGPRGRGRDRHPPATHRGQQSRAQQGGLARTGRLEHADDPLPPDARDQVGDEGLPAEEASGVSGAERGETQVGRRAVR